MTPTPGTFGPEQRAVLRGVLNVDKPAGITSYDVIRHLKPFLDGERIGHAGTLDPLAEGVLLVLLGSATKIAGCLQALDKEYEADIRLGIRTDTDDVSGRTVSEQPVAGIGRDEVTKLLGEFQGSVEQVPPVFSAVKVEGERSYRLARLGTPAELKPRTVLVRELALLSFEPQTMRIRAIVSSGTYIRALARDIGDRLGCGAVLQTLVRTRIGEFRIQDAVPLRILDRPGIAAKLVAIKDALAFMPMVIVNQSSLARLRNGQALRESDVTSGWNPGFPGLVRAGDESDRILALARFRDGGLKPERGIYSDL